ncbi:MAG: aldehyde dehydrogenase family protein [Steroidobacteraceae bacterium]|jgi:acyl-CoA reductase-like NAD-dependent aldehyde dehydrogenase|nr:aldehyde dehydrogenase family protein [Steroidobacteraceae bacterium]
MAAVQIPAPHSIAFLNRRHRLWIDGEWRDPRGGFQDVYDPASGTVIAQCPLASAEDVDDAVRAARRTFDARVWRGMPAQERARILWKLADLIEANAEEFAKIEVLNNGMPIAFARWMMGSCSHWLRHFAGLTQQIFGRNASAAMSGGGMQVHAYTAHEPVGVAGLIIPWNGPAGTFIIKVAPALAAGCSVVVKPSELTPITALWIAELAAEAGVPPGVLNVLPGLGSVAGQALVDHLDVDKISFTGSTAVGKHIVKSAASNLKRVTLELGGKSPCIVFDDADMDVAIPGAGMAIFANSGQVCFAGSRLFVQKKSYDRVVEGLAKFASSLKVGSGFDPETMVGPLISEKQRERVTSYIESGRRDGAEIVTGGGAAPGQGFFVQPTIFANTRADLKIVKEEIFGPVLVATPWEDLDDLIRLANDTRYGLGAGVFTTNLSTAHRVADRLQAGNVWVNTYGLMHPSMPFGGYKESGWGREMSTEGLEAYLEKKSVFMAL